MVNADDVAQQKLGDRVIVVQDLVVGSSLTDLADTWYRYSPDRDQLKLVKLFRSFIMLFMPLWTLDELKNCYDTLSSTHTVTKPV